MCLMLFAWKTHPGYPLVLAANRDESYARPSTPLAFWPDAPRVLAGRDLEKGGTWLGITRDGRFAGITNYRQAHAYHDGAPSRGLLVGDFLLGEAPPAQYLNTLKAQGERYNGFNLIAGDTSGVYYYSNRLGEVHEVAPGIHGLSNHLLDTPWPKVEQGKQALARMMALSGEELIDELFAMLASRTLAMDDLLPDTGVGTARERVLSPAFIAASGYGTRSSSVLLISKSGRVTFYEKSFAPMGETLGSVRHAFNIKQEPAR